MYIKLESASNDFYKHLKKLHTSKEREKTGHYIAEGTRSVRDAIKNNADIFAIVICEGYECDFDISPFKVYELSKQLFDAVKLTVTSQGIMAVIKYRIKTTDEIDYKNVKTLLYLDSVTDPGNMGTILRSADALGADAVVVSKGCVDIFNPKVVRSTMASLLNVPLFIDIDQAATFDRLIDNGFDILGTFPKAEFQSCNYIYSKKTALVMGNEANGISDFVASRCTSRLTIPMLGSAESLNVSTACTVMLYELMVNKIKNGEC